MDVMTKWLFPNVMDLKDISVDRDKMAHFKVGSL